MMSSAENRRDLTGAASRRLKRSTLSVANVASYRLAPVGNGNKRRPSCGASCCHKKDALLSGLHQNMSELCVTVTNHQVILERAQDRMRCRYQVSNFQASRQADAQMPTTNGSGCNMQSLGNWNESTACVNWDPTTTTTRPRHRRRRPSQI